jgi:DNA-binding transcriptional regulator YiaG
MKHEELRQIIQESKATNQQFARSLGVSRSCLNRWANGSTPIKAVTIPAIMQVLEAFKSNPPKFKLHQMGPRRRRAK